MGIGGISIWQLLIVLAIVVLLFGTKKLKNIGGDLGGAIKSFKKAVGEEDTESKAPNEEPKKVEDGLNPKGDPQARTAAADAEKSETKQS